MSFTEADRRDAIRDGCCACHINLPCSFCTLFTEDELDAYLQGGIAALESHWNDREAAEGGAT